ncbi:MAG: hypothetical protein LH617_05985 [Ramlibacter sp.]|nr:hypothetical protein [Ramlibacter sp.]
MNTLIRLSPLAAALALALLGTAQAQTSNPSAAPAANRSVAPATVPTPAFSTIRPGPAAPSASGLASPNTNTTGLGLNGPRPAGLPSPSPFPAGLPPVVVPTASTLPAPGTMVSPPIDGTVLMPSPGAVGNLGTAGIPNPANRDAAAAGATMGAGGGASTPRSVSSGAGPYTALQLAQSFQGADSNRDGELTRAEAQRLTIMPTAFDEMDRNRDGVISRSEYDDGSR